MRNKVGKLGTEHRTEVAERKEGDAAETQARQDEFAEVRRIEGLAGDTLWLSAVGVVLLLAGQLVLMFCGG